MHVEELYIKGCFVIRPQVYKDNRGSFSETFSKKIFKEKTGLEINFVQDNQSVSNRGVLRGLHYQTGKYAQAKLVRALKGKVLDVIVDLRQESETFGKHLSIELSEDNKTQLFIPRGFAHGFLALEEETIFSYKCDNYYNKANESGIRFDDPILNIDWNYPKEKMLLSEKDKALPILKDIVL